MKYLSIIVLLFIVLGCQIPNGPDTSGQDTQQDQTEEEPEEEVDDRERDPDVIGDYHDKTGERAFQFQPEMLNWNWHYRENEPFEILNWGVWWTDKENGMLYMEEDDGTMHVRHYYREDNYLYMMVEGGDKYSIYYKQ